MQHHINTKDLKKYGPVETLSEQVKSLLQQQKENWELVKNNYEGLKKVKERIIDFEDFQVKLQFNPERIRSSAAKTDQKSISERPCFLCEKNRPVQQKGIDYKGVYTILINPFPISKCHLTIPLNDHWDQEIEGKFIDMLDLSKALKNFTIFYNGPKCGASAPDHFHFQAGLENTIPSDSEANLISEKFGEMLLENKQIKISAVNSPYLRKFIFMQSSNPEELEIQFEKIHSLLPLKDDETEPMMNILCNYSKGKWEIVIFPRDKQRPNQFFAKGEQQILMSPASAEMGGLVILPREDDFKKIAKDDLLSIYNQVTLNDIAFERLKQNFSKDEQGT